MNPLSDFLKTLEKGKSTIIVFLASGSFIEGVFEGGNIATKTIQISNAIIPNSSPASKTITILYENIIAWGETIPPSKRVVSAR